MITRNEEERLSLLSKHRIADCLLTVRTHNVALNAGWVTLADAYLAKDQFRYQPNFGKVSVAEMLGYINSVLDEQVVIENVRRLDDCPKNTTGINPTEFKVLIAPKSVEEVTKGGIILPKQTTDTEKYACVEGTLIAASPLAFSYATAAEWDAASAQKPKPGDHVIYAKHAGAHVKGKDGNEYLLVNDKDLLATFEA